MLRKLSSVVTGVLVGLINRTASIGGSSFNIKDYDGNFIVTQYSESTNGATVKLNGKLIQSADGSTNWTDVPGGAFTEVGNTVGGAFESIVIESDSLQKYIAYTGIITGTTPSFAVGVSFAGYKKSTS